MKVNEYNQMMSYMLRPAQEAKLVDDLEPGSLKDELLKDFDPSQETYEEYLRRKSLERTNLAIGGGVIEGENLGTREGYADPNIEFPFLGSTGQTDYRIGKFKDTEKLFRRVGRNKTTIIQEEGESLEDFKKRKGPRTDVAFGKTVTTRNYIDNWTKNWLDNNLQKYGVRDFDVMLNNLSNDWQNEIEEGNVPEPKKNFNLASPKLNLPNITTTRDKNLKKDLTPFKYNNFKFYSNLENTADQKSKTIAQWKKIFYTNKIETNPVLRQGLKKFYDFMAMNKAGLPQGGGLTIRDFLKTEVSDDVKFLIDREASGLDKAAKKEVFHSFPDLKNNYDIFTGSKARLKAVERETEARIKAGPKTSAQTDKLTDQIKNQNKIVADMKPEELLKDKKLIQSLRLVINSKTGQVSFTGYTENDPKVIKKGVKTDLELAEHAIERAKKGSLFSYDHISKKSFGKMNTHYPNNIQGANYMTNSQMENARKFLAISENRNTPAAQNLDKVLEDLGLTIRGPEYGTKPIGNKENIIFNSNTNRSNIVDQQLIKRDVIPGRLGKVAGALGILVSTTAFGKEKSTLPQGSPAQINQQDPSFIEEYPLLTGAAAAATPLATKTGRKIYAGIGKGALGRIGKGALRTLGSVPSALGFSASQFVDVNPFSDEFGELQEDPNLILAGADLLLPELGKKFSTSGTGRLAQLGRYALNPFQLAEKASKFGKVGRGIASLARVPSLMTPVGLTLMGAGVGKEYYDFARDEIERVRAMSPEERQAYNEMLTDEGGMVDISREGFDKGGPSDPSRRKFMKIMGGLASLPIVGKFFRVAEQTPVVQNIFTEIQKLKNSQTLMPDWFPTFLDKFRREGTAENIFKKKKIKISEAEYDKAFAEGKGEYHFRDDARTQEYKANNPDHMDYYKLEDTDELIGTTYTNEKVPGVKVDDFDGEVAVTWENDYSQPVAIQYVKPGMEGPDLGRLDKFEAGYADKQLKPEGEFAALDQEVYATDPDGGYEANAVVVESLDDMMEGTTRVMEEYATGKKTKLSRGEGRIIEAEIRAEQAAESAAEMADDLGDFE